MGIVPHLNATIPARSLSSGNLFEPCASYTQSAGETFSRQDALTSGAPSLRQVLTDYFVEGAYHSMNPWTWLTAKVQTWVTRAGRRLPAENSPTMLRCRDILDLILAYQEGTLDPTERQAFEAHIADCVNCWRFLETYRETVALGQELGEEEIPPDVRERLETFLQNRLPPPP